MPSRMRKYALYRWLRFGTITLRTQPPLETREVSDGQVLYINIALLLTIRADGGLSVAGN